MLGPIASLSVLLITAGSAFAQTINVPLAQLQFSGGWATGVDPDCGVAYYYTRTTGSSVSYTFTGTAWTANILSLPLSGTARETMDGGATFDQNNFQSDEPVCTDEGFSADSLDPAQYTVRIEHTGTFDTFTYISAFTYESAVAAVSTSATLDPLLSIASTQSIYSVVSTRSIASTAALGSLTLTTATTTATAASLSSSASQPALPTSSSSSSSTSNANSSTGESTSKSISSGKIAGIVIAVIFGGTALLYLLWRCCKASDDDDDYDTAPWWTRLRRDKAGPHPSGGESPEMAEGKV